jgi:hypothetical protein
MIMTRYLLSAHATEDDADTAARPPMTEDQIREVTAQVMGLEEEMRSAGAWVFGGRLHGPDTATVVRVVDGAPVTTDGPFVEAREHLGGFYVIDAEDLDAALAWATKVTSIVGAPIEVRPFVDHPGA